MPVIMEAVVTPDERFVGLPGWSFAPRYVDVGGLKMHYVDEGPRDRAPILLLHGEPSWSYVYRKMIPPLVAAGHRCVAPDLVGFGRSDKPTKRTDHTYAAHVAWLKTLVEKLELERITLVCQDWGGLLGLRLAAENEHRFARIVAANTGLPTGDQKMPPAFFAWQRLSQDMAELPIGRIVRGGCVTEVPEAVVAAYDAPFPDESFKAGPRAMPMLVPTSPNDPASEANRRAWDVLRRWSKPFVTAFSDQDPITRGADKLFRELVPGCARETHATVKGAGHFLQEDAGEELARIVAQAIARGAGV